MIFVNVTNCISRCSSSCPVFVTENVLITRSRACVVTFLYIYIFFLWVILSIRFVYTVRNSSQFQERKPAAAFSRYSDSAAPLSLSFCSVIDLFSVIVLFCFVTVLRRVHIICHCPVVLLSPTSSPFCSVAIIVVLLWCRRYCHAVSSPRSAIVPFLCNAVVVLFCCRHCCPAFVIVSCFVVVFTLFC